MIRSLFFSQSGKTSQNLAPEQWTEALAEPEGLLWVDFESTQPKTDEVVLRQVFHFHPLAIDDALEEAHVAKVDDWGDYLYIVLEAINFVKEDSPLLTTQELDIFLGSNFIITHHDMQITALERVWSSIQRDDRHLRNGADHLLYRLIDEVVASYMTVVDALDDAIDEIEAELFNGPETSILSRIFSLKRVVLSLRRILNSEREVLNKLARDDYRVIDARDRIYFRDVYDHLVRLVDISEGIRDLITGILETYLSVINNRMNDIVKTLTVITTLFMPISFIASFFGMNYFSPVTDFSVWTGVLSFIIALLLMMLLPGMMLIWMRSKKFI